MAEFGRWKDLVDCRKEVSLLTTEAKEFFNDLGVKQPLQILFQDKHHYVSNLATNAVKYSGSTELRKLERDIVLDNEKLNDAIPIRALSVILAAKLFGNSESLELMSTKCKKEVEKLQLKLGFATEFLFLSQLFHGTVSNVPDISPNSGNGISEKHQQNKIATLVGDLLITKLFSALAALENNQLTETMMMTLAHLAEDAFSIDCQNSETKSIEVIFSQSFKCAVVLAGHSSEVQALAGELGQHFGRAYQTFRVLGKFSTSTTTSDHHSKKAMIKNLHTQIEDVEQFIHRIPKYSVTSHGFVNLLSSMKLEN